MEPERHAGQHAQLGVDRLHPRVGQPVQQAGDDPVPVRGDGAGKPDEGGDAAAAGPRQPRVQQRDPVAALDEGHQTKEGYGL